MHRSKRVFHFSKQSWNSCKVMPLNASVVFFFTSSTSAKGFPLRNFFIRGNKKKSGSISNCYFNSRHASTRDCFWSTVSTWGTNFAATLFLCNPSLKIRWQEIQDTPDKSTRSVNCSATVFQDHFTNSCDIFIRSGVRGSPWARLVCKWQFTIPEAGKPLVNLCFLPVQLPCKLFQALQLFLLPFSLTENRISQPNFVPTFQPSQKSTNKREALNKKIYYVAPRLHSTMPVGRLMQKGLRKRHLAAEACTTTSSPTRKSFRFLLGPPTYLTWCKRIQ